MQVFRSLAKSPSMTHCGPLRFTRFSPIIPAGDQDCYLTSWFSALLDDLRFSFSVIRRRDYLSSPLLRSLTVSTELFALRSFLLPASHPTVSNYLFLRSLPLSKLLLFLSFFFRLLILSIYSLSPGASPIHPALLAPALPLNRYQKAAITRAAKKAEKEAQASAVAVMMVEMADTRGEIPLETRAKSSELLY